MTELLSLARDTICWILSRTNDVKRNHAGCQFLVLRVRYTEGILEQLEERSFNPSVYAAIGVLNVALEEVQKAFDVCCQTNLVVACFRSEECALKLKEADGLLLHALNQISLSSLGMLDDIQSEVLKLTKQSRKSILERRANKAHQSRIIKDALNEEMNQSARGIEDLKNMISEVKQGQSSGIDGLKEEIVHLRQEAFEANEDRKRQHKSGVDRIVEAISQLNGRINKDPMDM